MSFVSPTRALIWREVRGTLWSRRSFFVLLAWVLCAVFVPYALWPDTVTSPFQFASQARLMVLTLCFGVLIGIGLTVPAAAAVSITNERDNELLDQLRLTLISNGGYVRGKAIASAVFGTLLILGLLPVLSVAQFIFGLDNRQIVQLIVYLLVFTLMCAMCGVASATLFRRTLVAVAVVYAGMSVALFFPAFFFMRVLLVVTGMAWMPGMSGRGTDAWQYFAPTRIVIAIVSYSYTPAQFAIVCAVPIVVTICMYAIAVKRVNRVSEPLHVASEKPIDDQAVLRARRSQFPFYLIDPLRRKAEISDKLNAMVVREIRWGLFSRGTWMVRIFYVTFIVFIFPMLGACMARESETRMSIICMQMVMVTLAAPVLVGSAWTKERELGNIDMVRMTLLGARELYVGKVAGGLVAISPVVGALLLTTIPAFAFHFPDSKTLLCGSATLLTCTLVAVSLCLYSSVCSQRTTSAIAVGMMLCVLATYGVYLFAAILTNSPLMPFSRSEDYPLRMLSPVMAYATSFGDASRVLRGPQRTPYLVSTDSENFAHWGATQLVFLIVAVAFAAMSWRRLSRREMRDV